MQLYLPFKLGDGSARFDIEYDWRVKSTNGYHKFPHKIIQMTTVTISGYVNLSKGNVSVKFYYTDPDENRDIWQNITGKP